jgi:hypothetical protein
MALARREAPDLGEVYSHNRGENLPDAEFLTNALRATSISLVTRSPSFAMSSTSRYARRNFSTSLASGLV